MRIMFLNHCPRGDYEARTEADVIAKVNEYASPGTVLDMHYPDDFPGSAVKLAMGSQNIMNGLYHALEVPHLVNKAVQAQAEGYDAVIQSNTFDPGVEASRLAVTIPVVGPLKTCLTLASTVADRIGVTVPLAGHVPHVGRIIRSYGLDHLVAGVRAMGAYVNQGDAKVRERARECARDLVEHEGAELIIPLGAALIPYRISTEEIGEGLGVPVMNTVSMTIRFTEFSVSAGLAQSPVAYPRADLDPSLYTKTLAD